MASYQYMYNIYNSQMQPSYNKNPQQSCKFGTSCKFYQQGKCRNRHDYIPNMSGNNQQNIPREYQNGGRMGGNPGNMRFRNNGQHGGDNNPKQHNQNDPLYKFCRFFMQGQCKKSNCNKIHGFTEDNGITRVMHTQDMPNHPNSAMGLFAKQGNNYFALRNANQISFYEYKFQNNSISIVAEPLILPEDVSPHYFAAKREWIFFAYRNSTNQLINIGSYDIFTKKFQIIENAHQKEVTDINYHEIGNKQILLSASIDGNIKAWGSENGGKLTLDQGITDGFKKCYDTGNNVQILFMDRKEVCGTIALVAGTSDNRILFWIGPNMQYRQSVFPQNYNRVLGVKFIQYNQAWVAIVLVWTSEKKSSALIVLDLTTFQQNLLLEKQAQTKYQLMAIMQSLGNYFLVGNIGGKFTIYKVPEFNKPCGFMMHRHCVSNIVETTSTLTTGINIKILLVLEQMQQNKKGSFAIYKLNE